MVIVSVIYPNTSESHFNREYYFRKHIPLVKSRWTSLGLTKVEVLGGNQALDGALATHEMMAFLTFTSAQQVHEALTKHGEEIVADIPRFTNVQPSFQFNDPISTEPDLAD